MVGDGLHRQHRRAGALALGLGGEKAAYPGALGTAVVKLAADLNAAKTGLTEKAAAEAGYPVITATCAIDDKAHYYPGSSSFIIKMIADKEDPTSCSACRSPAPVRWTRWRISPSSASAPA